MAAVKVWLRWDPTTEEAFVEDEAGNESALPLDIQRDGAFYLIGPIEVAEEP